MLVLAILGLILRNWIVFTAQRNTQDWKRWYLCCTLSKIAHIPSFPVCRWVRGSWNLISSLHCLENFLHPWKHQQCVSRALELNWGMGNGRRRRLKRLVLRPHCFWSGRGMVRSQSLAHEFCLPVLNSRHYLLQYNGLRCLCASGLPIPVSSTCAPGLKWDLALWKQPVMNHTLETSFISALFFVNNQLNRFKQKERKLNREETEQGTAQITCWIPL